MAKSDLYKISGHWDHYKDGMFVYTKKISARQLEKITKNAMFYAKIED